EGAVIESIEIQARARKGHDRVCRDRNNVRQRLQDRDPMAPRQVHDDLTRMDICRQRIDEPGEDVVGHSKDEEVAGSSDVVRIHDRYAGQQCLGADAGDVAARAARDHLVSGPS
ncbi:MAG: hypothetical protein RL347_788, partial [Actinomycetota bacterium]